MVTLRFLLALVLALCAGALPAGAQAPLPPEEARLEVVLDRPGGEVFEGEMVLATIRGTYGVRIALEDLTLPRMAGFEWIQLARDAWSDQRVDGRPVKVMERRIAFYPQRSGELEIPSLTHVLTVSSGTGARSERTVVSAPVPISVSPNPAKEDEWWLPAEAVEYSDTWDKDAGTLADGESTVRRVTLRALGATAQMLPPRPAMREPWLITFAAPEQRTTELTPAGPLTTVTWVWTLRPKTGEPGVLPDVQIPWFDTTARAARTVVLKAAPFGYAGFGDNSAARWRSGFSGLWLILVAALAGLLLTILLLAPGARLRSREEVLGPLRRWTPDADRRALRRALKRGDATAFRRAAHALLARAGQTESPMARTLLEPLDRHLYGPGGAAASPDLAALASRLRRLRARPR